MQIKDEALSKLELILKEDYPDRNFNRAEIHEIGLNLLSAVKAVYYSVPEKLRPINDPEDNAQKIT